MAAQSFIEPAYGPRGLALMRTGMSGDRPLPPWARIFDLRVENSHDPIGELVFWHAHTLADQGRVAEAIPLVARAFAQDASWATLL